MHAIVTIAGSQFRVQKDDTIVVPLLQDEPDSTLEFSGVLMTSDGDKLGFGSGKVTAKVIEHGKDKTVLVFHKKRRKGYQKLNGHRQPYTRLQITGITA